MTDLQDAIERTRLVALLKHADADGFISAPAQDLKALQRMGFCRPGGGMATRHIIMPAGTALLAVLAAAYLARPAKEADRD